MEKEDYTLSGIHEALAERRDDIPVFHVNSLGQYCQVTDFIREAWKNKVNARQRSNQLKGYVGEILPWFRGAKKMQGMLTPKLAREWIKYTQNMANRKTAGNVEHKRIYDLEDYYYDRFTRFGRPFLDGVTPMDEIEWNYIMRHHEIPSRLLDWTKGSLIALSYAVRHSLPTLRDLSISNQPKRSASKTKLKLPPEDAVVWMLEPRRLMEMTTQVLSNSKGIRNIASREDEVRGMRRDFFKDPSKYDEINKPDDKLNNFGLWRNPNYWSYPLPLIPSHISARVESHLSRFTLHSLDSFRAKSTKKLSKKQLGIPCEDESLYQFAVKAFDADTCWYLARIDLSGSDLLPIARVLRMTGVGDMNFTQDLDGLARELQIRAHLGFQDDLD
jgi:hypothetical protein